MWIAAKYRLPMKFRLRLLKFLKVNLFLFLLLLEKYPLSLCNSYYQKFIYLTFMIARKQFTIRRVVHEFAASILCFHQFGDVV